MMETHLKPVSSGYHSLWKSRLRCLSGPFLLDKSQQFATRPGGFIILSDFATYKLQPQVAKGNELTRSLKECNQRFFNY